MVDRSPGPVTFLATDIVGSVALWQRDEAAMSPALAVHDRMLREIIPEYGGHVIKGVGDGVWAAFDRPAAALEAGLAIQASIRATSWGALGELRVRIAIHSGHAELRYGDYYGPTPNRLARLVERAHGGQTLVSEATVRLAGAQTSAAFTLDSIGELRLRNLLEPLHVFELAPPGADLAAMRRDWEERVAAFVPSYSFPRPGRLVGRESELAALWSVLERGREAGQVALISAPAGTGKSALVGELASRARQMGVLCLAGGAYERAGVVPLGPLRDALGDYLLSQPAERLPMVVGDELADLSLVVPELMYRSGRAESTASPADLGRLSGAVFACLHTLAERQPVLLCIEDLHVADDGTLALIRHLVNRATNSRLTVCATFRGDEVEGNRELERLVASLTRDGATRIDIAPLDREQSGQLIAGLLDGPPSEHLRDALFTISEGNPLFLEQTALALREQGQIGRAGRTWHAIGDVQVGLPTVARDVLVQRLRRLSPRCYQTVAMAAVLGHTCEYEALSAAVAPERMLHLVEDLEEATQAQVLREVPAGYAFTHALLRDAVYGSLSPRRRELYHGEAGEALERLAGPHAAEHAAELAHHFVLAGRAPAMRARALSYSLEAGRRAAGLLLHHEALEHFRRVCELIDRADVADTQETYLEVLAGRLAAERELGMWPAMVETAEGILELAQDPLLRARARTSIGESRQRTGDMSAAVEACDAALEELDGAPRLPATASARLQVLGDKMYLLFLQARFAAQSTVAAEMLDIAKELGTPRAIEDAYNALAAAAMGRGRVDEGLAHFGECLTASERAHDPFRQALAHSNLGVQYQFAGEFAPARFHLERALELRKDLGAEVRNVNTIQRLGWVALGEGDLEKASELGELARDIAIRHSDRWAAECLDLLGTICTVKAEWSGAIEQFEHAFRLREHGPRIVGRIDTLLGLGTVHQQIGNWSEARRYFADALDVANSIDPSPWLVAARRQFGQLCCQLGEPEGRVLVRAAVALGETIPRSIQFGPTLLAAVECGCWDDDPAGAAQALERALTCGLTAVVRADVLCELARLQAESGDVAAARSLVERARVLTDRLGSPRLTCRVTYATGLIAAATGDREAAAQAFEVAVDVARQSGLAFEVERLESALNRYERARLLMPVPTTGLPTFTSDA